MSCAAVVLHLRPVHADEMPRLATVTMPLCRLIKALTNVGTRKIIQKERTIMKIALEATPLLPTSTSATLHEHEIQGFPICKPGVDY